MPRIYQRTISLFEVKITRNGGTATIDYIDPAEGAGGTILEIGPDLAKMSDSDIIKMHNDMVLAIKEHQEEHPYVAIEIPEGKPQIEYSNVLSAHLEYNFLELPFSYVWIEVDGLPHTHQFQKPALYRC